MPQAGSLSESGDLLASQGCLGIFFEGLRAMQERIVLMRDVCWSFFVMCESHLHEGAPLRLGIA